VQTAAHRSASRRTGAQGTLHRDSDELRELGLITLKKQTLTILNCKMLQAYAEFDPFTFTWKQPLTRQDFAGFRQASQGKLDKPRQFPGGAVQNRSLILSLGSLPQVS
jgi:hypothetical protein